MEQQSGVKTFNTRLLFHLEWFHVIGGRNRVAEGSAVAAWQYRDSMVDHLTSDHNLKKVLDDQSRTVAVAVAVYVLYSLCNLI